ncbi:MAG: hypothetical protein GXP48_02460 [Acidobacteria bacterium]|nr:hypothetical protein [Acidobacteriota bacterium]
MHVEALARRRGQREDASSQEPGRWRSPYRRASLLLLALAVALGLSIRPASATPPAPATASKPARPARPLHIKIKPVGVRSVFLIPKPGGGYLYKVTWRNGRVEKLPPDRFADLLYSGYSGRKPLYYLLNITSPIGIAWVAFGLFGQVLFTGRMIVQWFVSERRKRSVVPVAFWWMSLGGASMLVIYFIWRRDIVGILGQSTGWIIYTRNLWLIYHHPSGLRESPVE